MGDIDFKILGKVPENPFNVEENTIYIVPFYNNTISCGYLVGPLNNNGYRYWEKFDKFARVSLNGQYKKINGLQDIISMALNNDKNTENIMEKLINSVDGDLRKTIDLVESNW